MSSSVDQIKSKLDIVSVIGGYIKLEKTGANFKGKCPFHNEKTPSFFVSVDRNTYYCFGCQAKGDIFTFVEEFEGLDFKGALKVLADRAGVTLDNGPREDTSDKDALFSVLELATFFFEKNLSENKEAKDYLKSRGVTEETITLFRLGYVSAEWRGLYDFLVSKGVKDLDMERAGLIKRRDGGGFYDTFRSRIVFPIADSSGRIVAFSGRIFPNDPNAPKYLNSPETPIFHKSEILYGLDKAKKDIHARDYSILVEGQMDLIMLHQSGLGNTVASSGTALTEAHLVRLNRLSNRLIMAFDGDAAGFKAIVRGAEIALGLGMEVKVAVQTLGNDPADMALNDKDGLLKSIKDAQHVVSFVLGLVIASSTDSRVAARKVVADVLPFVSRLPSMSEQSHFVREIQTRTGIAEDALWNDLRTIQNPHIKFQAVATPEEKKILEKSDLITKKLFGILLWQKKKTVPDIDIDDLEEKLSESLGKELFNLKLSEFETVSDALIFEAEAYYSGRGSISSDIIELIVSLTFEKLKKKQLDIMAHIRQAEVDKDMTRATELSAEFNAISKEINNVKNRSLKSETGS